MLFVVLGSQKFQFNRLLKELDKLKQTGKITDTIIAQSGYSDYKPHHFETIDFINKEQFNDYIHQAEIVICHGGTGVIVNALKQQKKVIALPRRLEFEEHIDNHQAQIVSMFGNLKLIEPCFDVHDLEISIQTCKQETYKPFISNNDSFVSALKKEIDSLV